MHRILYWLSRLICAVRGHAWRGGDGCRPWCARCATIGPMPALSPDVGAELLALHHGAEVRAGVIARLERDYAELKREADASERVCEQLEQQLAAERASFEMMRAARATHRCKVCCALWVQHPAGGGWSLCSDTCGKCCDNEAMGDQIEAIGVTAERDDLRRQLAAAHAEHDEIHEATVDACYRALESMGITERPDGGGQPDYLLPAIVSMSINLIAERPRVELLPPGEKLSLPSPGIIAIAAERQRQIEVEGWTPDHDDRHALYELASAASAYAFIASLSDRRDLEPPGWWPWSRTWWKPKDRRRDLERAGALIAAEIDREYRCAARGK